MTGSRRPGAVIRTVQCFQTSEGLMSMPGPSSTVGTLILCAVLAGAAAAAIRVDTYGSLREIIHAGRIEARVPVATALARPHAYALGARARLDGEFVVLDGRVFETRPDRGGAVRPAAYDARRDSATLLVVAHVSAWHDIRVTRPIAFAAIEDTLAARAPELGLPAGGPFPFLIEGPVTGLRWHVADGRLLAPGPSTHEAHQRAAVRGGADALVTIMLGFYSDHHQGVFTHHDSEVHLHVLLPEARGAAHVDSACVAAGAVLRLPVR
jgi:acetolactate decarboxylase